MSTAVSLPGVIRDKLRAMDRQQRELAAVRGVGEFLLFTSVAIALCLFADSAWNLSPSWRIVMLAALAGGTGVLLWFRVMRPLLRRRSWADLAAAVEQQHPELTERLTTLVELQSDSDRTGSTLMHELLAKQTVKAVSQVDFTQALPAGKSLQRAALGLVALAVLLFPFLLPGGRYSLSWNRLLNPWGNYDWGSRLAFHVPDGDRVVARGTDVTLQAELQGEQLSEKTPLEATLRWVDAGGRAQQRAMTWDAEDQTYSWTIPRVEQSFRFRISSRRAVSREYHVTAADRPRVTAINVDVQPPGYTGLPAQSLDAVVGELRVPEQSQIRFRWQFAEPVATAVLHWPEAFMPKADAEDQTPQTDVRQAEVALNLSADRRSATVQVPATASGLFELQLQSDLGLDSEEPAHKLAIIPDEPPEISVERDELFAAVRPDDVLPIPLSARDDYGLTAVELHWQTSLGQEGRLAIPAEELTGRQYAETLKFDLTDLNVLEGQSVTFRLRAVDNRPLPSPQETWTDPFEVAITAQSDSLESRQLAAAQEQLEKELDKLEEAVALQKQAVDTEHRETARDAVKGDAKPENQEELDRLRQRQQQLREQLEALRNELDQRPFLEKAAQEHVPNIEEQLAKAQQGLDKAAQAEGKRDQIEQLSKSLDELAQAEDQLAKLKQEAKALAALEQELSELARLSRQAEKLADRAESLEERAAKPQASDDAARGDQDRAPDKSNRAQEQKSALAENAPQKSPPTAEELEALRQETDELAEHLDDLLRRRPELLESARQHELERLSRLAEMAERLAEPQGRLAAAISQEAKSGDANSPDDNPAAADKPSNNPSPNGDANTPSEKAESKAGNSSPKSADKNSPQTSNESSAKQPDGESSINNPKDAPPESSKPDASSAPSQSPSEKTSANQPQSNGDKSSPQPNASPKSRDAESKPANRELAEQISQAVQQQQQLAREAAQLQREVEQAQTAENKPGESKPANSQANQTPEAQSLAQFAKQSREAAESAKAGDLKQAAQQSQGACKACQSASQSGGKSGSPTAPKAGQLAEKQDALAQEFERLSQSPEARQTAQQQSQQQLNKTAQSLAKALEQSAQRLSQQPLDLQKSGQCASGACQSAKSAGNSMSGASQSLAQGDKSGASQQAQSAQQQLQQAAQEASQAAGDKPASSPQGAKVPGDTASQVAQAASQLKQAQNNLAQAEQAPNQDSNDSNSSPSAQNAPSENAGPPDQPTQGKPGQGQEGQGKSGEGQSSKPGSGESDSNQKPNSSPLERSVEQLRQAAQALSAASKAGQSGSQGKPGSPGQPGSPGKSGSPGQSKSSLAQKSSEPKSEPGNGSEPTEGFADFGAGATGVSESLDELTENPKAAVGARNWGRLPKNLQSEIRQGSTKKPHPEYSRQIKRYFEKIAQPAEKRN